MRLFIIFVSILFFNIPELYASGAYNIDNLNPIIGFTKTYKINGKETLIELAREYNLGYNEIVDANPDIDPWIPKRNENILLPTSWLIPEIFNDDGIIINLAELRLYYFINIANKRYVRTHPLGIGREGFDTPTGVYKIIVKVKDPTWTVPENIRIEKPDIPPIVPPGPENPLGGYWLQLSAKGYGIHGTNRPYGIGRRVSHGCIRLYPEDIEQLFKLVKLGTAVKIIDEPVKIALYKDKVYMEVHRSNKTRFELKNIAFKEIRRKNLLKYVDNDLILNAIKYATGLPTIISQQ